MQNKKETQVPKTGRPSLTSLWSMPNLSNTLVAPIDVVKQKLQTQSNKQKPLPIWNLQNLFTAAWYSPFEVVKQQLQTPKTTHKPVTTPGMPNPVTTPLITPLDEVKQQLQNQTPEPGKKPVASPVWSLPSYAYSTLPSMATIHQQLWYGTNFIAVALATSLSIVAVQSPVKTMLVNLTKNGTMIPTYQGGLLGFFRAMYAGTSASISGSMIRTGYVTGAKGSSKSIEEGAHEAGKEEGKKYASPNYGYIMAMALGDILVTQIPGSLSTLKKVPGLLPVDFVWKTPHNAWKLMMGGFVPRYGSGMVNFASLCLLEDRIAKGLPIQDKNVAHFTSGMFSGMVAALFSYPFTSFIDYAMVQSKVVDGRLQNANSIKLTQELFYCFINNPEASLKSFGSMALKQVPMRMGLTGVIFALVAGVGEIMGQEPLQKVVPQKYQPSSPGKSKHTMFSAKETTPLIEEILTSEKKHDTDSTPAQSNRS